MSCSPVLTVGPDAQTVGLFCSPNPDAPEDNVWEVEWTAETWPDGDDLLEAIVAHGRAHRPPRQPRERTRKPKFGSGLGLSPGTKITTANSVSST